VRTQVGIIGAGPAGLVLAHLLRCEGIESVILERHTREYIEKRVRAGVLEQGTVDLVKRLGLGERMQHEGMVHRGIQLSFEGVRHHIDFADLTGRSITVYGQQELVKDLVQGWIDVGGAIHFSAEASGLHSLESERPRILYLADGAEHELECDVVAGCDGSHGICRQAVPSGVLSVHQHIYPLAWLGILAQAAPVQDELVYCYNPRGFALFSMRSPQVTRLYLQVAPDERLDRWSDDRIWHELHARLDTSDGWRVNDGPVLEKSITPMRAYLVEPMQYHRLYLAGDAAHIVPPTGAKGLNLAVADVLVLAPALAAYFRTGERTALERYSRRCLRRVWRAQHFSWWMTSMLHIFPEHDEFQRRLQISQLAYTTHSRAAATSLAENYVGLPMDWHPEDP
jgi:p-hydroxybenzoate 3-monooxygenase